jgi:hypothetical protein
MEFNIKTKEQNFLIKEGMILTFKEPSKDNNHYTITDIRKTPFLSRNGEFSFIVHNSYGRIYHDRYKEKDIIKWLSRNGQLTEPVWNLT